MQNISNKLIVALDVMTNKEAKRFVDRLYPKVNIFKIGPVLFTADGPKVAELIRKKGAEIFLDLKYHDIPNTVANAVRQAVRLKVKMLTLHVAGGQEMLKQAAQAAKEESAKLKIKKPLLLGITILTSDQESVNTKKIVLERAGLAKRSGLDGIVCSVREAAAVRKACGRDFVIVTPGIRPEGKDVNDQKRVASAKDAISAGADYIVVGRPILEAKKPLEAAKNIIKELE